MGNKPLVFLFVASTLMLAAVSQPLAKTKAYYLRIDPVPVTNYLAGTSSYILQPYLKLSKKNEAKVICVWMPRIQDALMTALNRFNDRKRTGKRADPRQIEQVLIQAIRQAAPLKIPLTVKAFSLDSNSARQQEKRLKGKIKCE